jgi:ABC-type phosphate/phosphonate transport system substrate-binding protein
MNLQGSGVATRRHQREKRMMNKPCSYGSAGIIFLILALVHGGDPRYAEGADSYTFGVVPQYDQRQMFSTWKPILTELEKRTALSFKLVSSPAIPAFEKAFLKVTMTLST